MLSLLMVFWLIAFSPAVFLMPPAPAGRAAGSEMLPASVETPHGSGFKAAQVLHDLRPPEPDDFPGADKTDALAAPQPPHLVDGHSKAGCDPFNVENDGLWSGGVGGLLVHIPTPADMSDFPPKCVGLQRGDLRKLKIRHRTNV
jgi:hypothetical protein